MLLTYEEGIRGAICNKVHSYAEANNKYMNNHNYKQRIIIINVC